VPQGGVPHRRGRDQARAGRRLRRSLGDRTLIDERAFAGQEHLDPAYVAGYDRKAGVDVQADVALLRELGLGADSTLVDLGAGTGLFAAAVAPFAGRVVAVDPSPAMLDAARARGGFETVEAGFLTYEHHGERPAFVYTRNALHHLPDFWKTIALVRVHDLLADGGTLVLRDIVYAFEPGEAEAALAAWYAAAAADPAEGWTAAELEQHVRTEHSTFSWLLEAMLEHAGFVVRDRWSSESRTYARYVCNRGGAVA
jgi:SAM-dependent methyltransferase